MPDVFSVTAAWVYPAGKTSYTTGDVMKFVISGGDVLTQTTTSNATLGPFSAPLVAADGATSTVNVPATSVTVTTTTSTPESVKMSGPPTDPSGRVWTVAADGLSATATA
jgi:hypothetical protein